MKIFLAILLIIYGLIHLMGFSKAFQFGTNTPLKVEIPKSLGVLWLSVAVLFIVSAALLLFGETLWMFVAIAGIILSQILIFITWKEAKYGALLNIVILVAVIFSYGSIRFENEYQNDVTQRLQNQNTTSEELLTEADLQTLPLPVQKYLRYCGVVNQPKVKNMKVVFEGEMRDKGKDYFKFQSEQYNFFDEPTRLFFMKVKMFGMTVPGYHKYAEAKASMNIKIFGIFPVISHSGAVMDKTETVTLFNDMCLMAPATLIDKRIQWQTINNKEVKATFINHDIKISATLYFNDKGQLINFISQDRTAVADGKTYPFSTPVKAYKNYNGLKLMQYGEAVWHYPDGNFTYGKFWLKEIRYNCK